MSFGYSYWSRREPLVPRAQMWANEEAKTEEERRRRYRCRDRFVTLEHIPAWPAYRAAAAERRKQEYLERIAARRRWLAKRKAMREAKKQRIAEKRERKAQREELRRIKREEALKRQQAKEQAALEQKQKEEEEALKQKQESEQQATAGATQEEQPPKEDAPESASVAAQEATEDQPENRSEEAATTKKEEEEEDDDDDDEDEDEVEDEEDEIPTSSEESELSSSEEEEEIKDEEAEQPEEDPKAYFAPDEELNNIITIWHGNITTLEIDAIVNAANKSLLGGGGIDGAIHSAAGDELYNECRQLNGCDTGHCKISRGYAIPAKYILHTVGPIGEKPVALRSCYLNCLRVAVAHGVRSVAFCGISTGIYGYPLYEASHIALRTVRRWLEEGDNRTKFDRIIFCTFLDKERDCYEKLMPLYFPLPGASYEVLPLQPEETQEVPPMIEEESSSSEEEANEEDEKEDEEEENDNGEAASVDPTAQPANANSSEVNQLTTGVGALSLSAEDEQQPAAGSETPANANDVQDAAQ